MLIVDDYGNQIEAPSIDEDGIKELSIRVMRIEGELVVGASRMTRIEAAAEQTRADMEENTAMTKNVLESLADVVEFFTAMKGAFKVLNWLGAVAKPVGAIVGLITAAAVAWKAWGGTS